MKMTRESSVKSDTGRDGRVSSPAQRSGGSKVKAIRSVSVGTLVNAAHLKQARKTNVKTRRRYPTG